MTMEWLLIVISIGLLLLNVVMMLTASKKKMDEDPAGVHESMVEFVAQLEKENDELYDKLTTYIKSREAQLAERIERLEKNPAAETEAVSEKASENQEKILQLSRQGFSSKQIAKVLQTDYGKVELVVNMKNKRHGNFKEDEVL
ncbi:hypothetical protein [uncultured Planococcus sp.]|uniref:DUF6115 domain-containing protein n=1 Tax=uncultured Planococcus sp. TaxID=337815 RepID=UPI00262FC3E2|nr:hypothetical protein [uncultured Planococcus sp.]